MLYDNRATDKKKPRPWCDLCANPAVADAKTVMGPWMYVCTSHWAMHCRGRLGLGLGQFLLCDDEHDSYLKEYLETHKA